MKRSRRILLGTCLLASLAASGVATASGPATLQAQNETLFSQLREVHGSSDEQLERVRAIFRRSGFIGQGNPAITRHPMTPEECRARLDERKVRYDNAEFDRICGAPYMSPLYDPASGRAADAGACIDRFEFPNIPCAYPVVWVRAREAAELCEALGKRLCDAHEWEGACAGSLQQPDYSFELARDLDSQTAVRRMREAHNRVHDGRKVWAYGPEYRTGICATGSSKSPQCEGGGWATCGSNTYPAGAFPDCRSPLGVLDLHGNAAEHMNLPLSEQQMASRGSRELGSTEMKGSWFVFDRIKAHEDACRWRAPFWHGSRVMDLNSHHNYHLGFRCCKTLPRRETAQEPSKCRLM